MTQHPKPNFNTILIVPVGAQAFGCALVQDAKFLDHIRSYVTAFYYPLPVEVFDTPLSLKGVSRRSNEHDKPQYLISEIFSLINKKTLRNSKVYLRLGILFDDIYPGDEWNFVYGQAIPSERVGVFSFARHSSFFNDGLTVKDVDLDSLDNKEVIFWLKHSMHTAVHEIGHLFNIKHCIYYQCFINGSNGAGEHAGKSSFECPVCLRKVLYVLSIGSSSRVEVVTRYERLIAALESINGSFGVSGGAIGMDVTWLRRRISFILGDDAEPKEEGAETLSEQLLCLEVAEEKGEV